MTEDVMMIINSQIKKYEIVSQLGEGGFASVFLGRHYLTKEFYAIKAISRDRAMECGLLCYLENELRLISRFDHPNIVKMYEIIYLQSYICIIMEYCPNGDLNNVINSDQPLHQCDKNRIALEILEALDYLHSRGISHRDIKPANIMFDKDMHVKLIDFGFAREQSESVSTMCGTQMLMAPEVICNYNYDGRKADMWSLAITLHALAVNCLPFEYRGDSQLAKDMKSRTLPINIIATGMIGWIVRNTLIYDPDKRASTAEILNHVKNNEYTYVVKRLPRVKRAKTSSILEQVEYRQNTPHILKVRTNKEGNPCIGNRLVRSKARFF
ncbi:CAMK family protein kinase [Trichomonas vaginalis G3]|uniref:CAMK family protein kinase n=1 Tax=Trichomonas vaginalis (strain ATCC PRA-98 / G3) TaxID=412133 RepID=A2F9L5_TRIV3|nr:protein serine/threonine kinase protein [Trichomonas vaginalis G3]EAX98396.1 CAMK family protein kinase [Trichomonas vaginalis G3]KAI5486581.1 protein serine/threonine kinase protein [Trichomonas vaginalis G3]|eukprot:XP_001311326.1 CAMK family protein kinase [Trichomonas vaginalis G3]